MVFGRKKSIGAQDSPPPPPLPSKSSSLFSSSKSKKLAYPEPISEGKVHLDDWGRMSGNLPPAFVSGGAGTSGGNHYGVGEDELVENSLIYGYTAIETEYECEIEGVLLAVRQIAEQIKTRGVDTPLILSSTSLDISLENTSSLIRGYIADRTIWAEDLHLASPIALASFLKWLLARLMNQDGSRGFLDWNTYQQWTSNERASSYPPQFIMELFAALPRLKSELLATLLDLFSSVAAHSGKNGMVPRRIAALFSPYILGLSVDKNFDETIAEWTNFTSALEHILLSFLRNQQVIDGRLPTHLEPFILGYPNNLNISSRSGGTPKPPKGGRVEEVLRIRRLTRFHSRNLIASAGTWEVPRSLDWSLFFPSPSSNPRNSHSLVSSTSNLSLSSPLPVYTAYYRHLLNIRSHSFNDEEYDEGDLQRYSSVVEKEWGRFGELGFKEVDGKSLEFDLTEGERKAVKQRPMTMEWNEFADQGFGGRETFLPSDLIFHQTISQKVNTWSSSNTALQARLLAAQDRLPPFPYDTAPQEAGKLLIEEYFFEAWADVVGTGWAREELKESSFGLIQWKSRPREGESLSRSVGTGSGTGDERTVDRWVLVEELVPKEYRDGLAAGQSQGMSGKKTSKRISFLRSVRRKNTTKVSTPPRLNVSQVSPSPPSQQPTPNYASSETASNSQSPIRADPSVYNRRNDASATTIRMKAGQSVHGGSPPIDNLGGHFESINHRIVEEENEVNSAGRGAGTRMGVGSPKGKSGGGFLARMSSRVGKNSQQDRAGGRDEDGIMLAMSRSMSSEGFSELAPRTDSAIPPPPPPKAHQAPRTPPLQSNQFSNNQSIRSSPISNTPHPFVTSRTVSPNISPSINNDRSSFATATDTTQESEGEYEDDSAYDGIDENEIVLFRGSRSYPTDLADAPTKVVASVHPFSQSMGPSTSSSSGGGREVPSIVLQMPPSSLPPSPKAPADVPEDATLELSSNGSGSDGGMRRIRRESGHSDIVGLYDETRDDTIDADDRHDQEEGEEEEGSKSNVVRLTQYFGGGVVQGSPNGPGGGGDVRPGPPVLGGVVSG